MPLFAPRVAPILCVSHRDADYPTTTPADVIPCGPILLPAAAPLRTVDVALAAWIERPGRATVLVVLGSHLRLDEPDARAVLAAAAALLRARPDVQVLWKLQRFTRFALPEVDGEGGGVFGDRLRVVGWLEADPVAVLRTGRVVAFVNHGGSNSYHEALAAGVPQVILSPWYDCHDFGNRAEWLRIGKWANKSSAPLVNAAELTNALLTVVGTDPDAPEAMGYRKRAQEISEVVTGRRKGWYDERTRKIEVGDEVGGRRREGRDVAAEFIWERMEEEEVKKSRAFGLNDDGSVLQSYLHLRKVEDLE
ncbi:Sfi1 spindle body [Neofusicoccum parvum]|nr:Sfi1 spindle body [Neofusicoccum parvum]